jgi:hypothetical protein
MNFKVSNFAASRRQFLKNVLPAGTLFCFGCSNLFALSKVNEQSKVKTAKHKFLEDSEMSYQEVFSFAYDYIWILEEFAKEYERDEFVEKLKKIAEFDDEYWIKFRKKNPPKDWATFKANKKKLEKSRFVEHILTSELAEETDKTIRIKITECLYAKTFRESNASDFGYALICYSDYEITSGANPKVKLIRPTTLMEGHDFCDFLYVWEG